MERTVSTTARGGVSGGAISFSFFAEKRYKNFAILQELARYIEGGYYEEVDDIKALENDPDWVEI